MIQVHARVNSINCDYHLENYPCWR